MTFCLLSTMRNEAPFIHEWVAYHRAIGFEKIVVYSNDCTDGTDTLLDDLAAAGFIEHINHKVPEGLTASEAISASVLDRKPFQNGDWVIWLDADEFLNIHVGDGKVSDLADTMTGETRGMCISWRLFGDSGHETVENGFISQDFPRCAAPGDGWKNVKTLFRYAEDVIEYYQHKPILKKEFWLKGGRFVDGNGQELSVMNDPGKLWRWERRSGKIGSDEGGWSLAQINHYAVRTKAHQAEKARRGRIGQINVPGAERYTQQYFDQMNKNDDQDTSILKWRDETVRLANQQRKTIAERNQTASDTAKTERTYRSMHVTHKDEIEARSYSNAKLAQAIISLTGAKQVLDVGCGIGLLMQSLSDKGVHATGIEGPWLSPDAMVRAPKHYLQRDLEQPFTFNDPIDVVVSIEVAEHLEPLRAAGFVADLCKISEVVVFSAAIEGQGGRGHKNEQWQDYWCALFEANGYGTYDVFRSDFLRDTKLLPWFRQNVLLFVKEGHALAAKHADHKIAPDAANMILPEYHRKILRRTRRALREKIARARSQ